MNRCLRLAALSALAVLSLSQNFAGGPPLSGDPSVIEAGDAAAAAGHPFNPSPAVAPVAEEAADLAPGTGEDRAPVDAADARAAPPEAAGPTAALPDAPVEPVEAGAGAADEAVAGKPADAAGDKPAEAPPASAPAEAPADAPAQAALDGAAGGGVQAAGGGDKGEVGSAEGAVGGDSEAAPVVIEGGNGDGGNASVVEGEGRKEDVALSAAGKALLSAMNVTLETVSGAEKSAIQRGVVADGFSGCGVGTEGGCYKVGSLVDRVEVGFDIDSAAVSADALGEYLDGMSGETFAPHVAAEGGRAVPVVSNLRIDKATSSGSIVLKYHCATPEDDGVAPKEIASLITFSLPLSISGAAAEITWSKTCGSGDFPDLVFGYLDHNRDVVAFNADGSHGDDQRVGMEVSPHSSATVLSLFLDGSTDSLDFMAPYVTSSRPEDVKFSVRGSRINGTILTPGEETEISIMYECVASVNSEFTATIGIPPWKNLTAKWTKDCGGHLPRSLVIGSTVQSSFNVLQDGELASSYSVAPFSSAASARGKGLHVLDASTHSALFYLTNAGQTSDIHLQSVTVTLDSDKMMTEVEEPSMQPLIGAGYVSKNGAVIGRGESKRLSLHFYCRASGDVLVMVTLTTLLFQNVEFGFLKECVEGRVYQRSALTAGSLMSAILFACFATAVLACVYYVRKRRRETELGNATYTARREARGKYSLVDDQDVL